MNKKQDIKPYNDKGNPHGYWEVYYDGKLWFSGNYINGWKHGFWEGYYNGEAWYKINWVNGRRQGYREWDNFKTFFLI